MDYLQYSMIYGIGICITKNKVLNLIINGLPSIHLNILQLDLLLQRSFKPYYKWITFNTHVRLYFYLVKDILGFKPYYKWITFNTC